MNSAGLTITLVLASFTSFLIQDCPFSINPPVASAFGVPSKLKFLTIASSPYLPHWILNLMYNYFPGEGLALVRENRRVAVKVTRDLVESKIWETRDGKSGRDILMLLGAFGL